MSDTIEVEFVSDTIEVEFVSETVEVEYPSVVVGATGPAGAAGAAGPAGADGADGSDGSLAFPDLADHPAAPVSGVVGYRFASTGEVWLLGASGVPSLLTIVP